MSACDSFGTFKTPCPNCGGKVEYWYFSSDCRGNESSRGIDCKGCGKKFTSEEWDKVVDAERGKNKKAKKAIALFVLALVK